LEIHGDLASILALADENGIAGERLFVMERVAQAPVSPGRKPTSSNTGPCRLRRATIGNTRAAARTYT